MIFSSLVFMCVFLPIVCILYWAAPSLKLKNALLILASLLFYAYGEPVYVGLLILSSLLNYFCALGIDKYKEKKKPIMIVAIAVNLGVLAVFKYTGFLISTCNGAFGTDVPIPEIVMPIGISFFTFQALSYVVDVYYDKVKAEKSYWVVLLYISFFPQLIAGPIIKFRDIGEQIRERHHDLKECVHGVRRFVGGLGKKILIANTMGLVADTVFSASLTEVNALTAWLGAIAYMMQIYYDFSGYSDMAIGLGKLFGFQIKENFMYPYGVVSIKDFWRRWHMSLSGWFKEYLYIPLGGNRKGRVRTAVNKMIVFFFTGLWHGANWTFVIWGLYHGAFLFLEEFVPAIRKLPKVLGHIYSVLVVCVGFVIFRADTLMQGLIMIKKMFTDFAMRPEAVSLTVAQLTPWFLCILIVAVIGAAPIRPVADCIRSHIYHPEMQQDVKWQWVQRALNIMAVVGLAWCIIRLSGGTYNPFIYFRF